MTRTRASAKAAGSRFESQVAAYLANHIDDRYCRTCRRNRNQARRRGHGAQS